VQLRVGRNPTQIRGGGRLSLRQDPTHVLEEDDVQVHEDLTIGVGPVRILDCQVKQLRGKEIQIVKVLWEEATQEMTWEMEDLMRKSYPHLFPGKFSFSRMKAFKVGGM